MGERIGLAMGDPHLRAACLADRRAQVVPVRMVGNHERQLDAALARAGAHAHPARSKSGDGIWKLTRPDVLNAGRRAKHDLAREFAAPGRRDLTDLAQRRAFSEIKVRDLLQRAMQMDGPLPAGLADQRHHALRLTEGVGAHQMRAFWEQTQRRHELFNFAPRVRMAKHRQAEGRLADEHVAGHDFKRRAGGIAGALVIAGDDDALARVGHADLRGTEHMTGGMEAHVHAAETDRFAISGDLPRAAKILSVPQRHDGQRLARGQNGAMPPARVIGMGVSDERARHGAHGIDVKIARRAVKASGRGLKKMRRHGPNIGEPAPKQRGLAPRAASGQKRAMHSSGDILADRRFAWAQAAAAEGDHAGARDLLEQTLERAPGWAPALLALGDSLAALGEDELAARAWTRAAHADPGGVLGAQLRLAARGHGQAPERAPDDYVRALFDEYADRFDAHLLGALAYRGPQILRGTLEQARAAQGAPMRFARAMDLGCGTGLMAAALADCADAILGADLSPRMVEAARRSGLYARVDVCDVAQALAAQEDGALDLVIAADVFVYLGDLAPVFEGAARVLAKGGLFAFTVQEGRDAQDWALGADLRYVHSAAYLRRLAQSHGLAELALTQASTRKDAGADVPGLVAAFARA